MGKGTERLIRAYLSQRMNITDHNELVSLGSEVGLNEQDVGDALNLKRIKIRSKQTSPRLES